MTAEIGIFVGFAYSDAWGRLQCLRLSGIGIFHGFSLWKFFFASGRAFVLNWGFPRESPKVPKVPGVYGFLRYYWISISCLLFILLYIVCLQDGTFGTSGTTVKSVNISLGAMKCWKLAFLSDLKGCWLLRRVAGVIVSCFRAGSSVETNGKALAVEERSAKILQIHKKLLSLHKIGCGSA